MYNHDLQILISGTYKKNWLDAVAQFLNPAPVSIHIARQKMETEESVGGTHMQYSGRNDNRLNLKNMVLSVN